MKNQLTIVMYHFVRELTFSRYPGIKGLLASRFAGQLDYLGRHYEFVSAEDCLRALAGDAALPEKAVLLTFDDGYADHFTTVFPMLDARGIRGCFFPPAKAVVEHEVLGVNKLHFLLAGVPAAQLVEEIFSAMDDFRSEYGLHEREWYLRHVAHPSRFDPPEVCLIKGLLQFELEEPLRERITGLLFARHITENEAAFSRELYMSTDQLRCMIRHGMHVGSHGYGHLWLNKVAPDRQAMEVDRSIEFLAGLGAPVARWVMSYPYGGFDESLISVVRSRGCAMGLTAKVGIATLAPDAAWTLPRLDTNDLPCDDAAAPAHWTAQV